MKNQKSLKNTYHTFLCRNWIQDLLLSRSGLIPRWIQHNDYYYPVQSASKSRCLAKRQFLPNRLSHEPLEIFILFYTEYWATLLNMYTELTRMQSRAIKLYIRQQKCLTVLFVSCFIDDCVISNKSLLIIDRNFVPFQLSAVFSGCGHINSGTSERSWRCKEDWYLNQTCLN